MILVCKCTDVAFHSVMSVFQSEREVKYNIVFNRDFLGPFPLKLSQIIFLYAAFSLKVFTQSMISCSMVIILGSKIQFSAN